MSKKILMCLVFLNCFSLFSMNQNQLDELKKSFGQRNQELVIKYPYAAQAIQEACDEKNIKPSEVNFKILDTIDLDLNYFFLYNSIQISKEYLQNVTCERQTMVRLKALIGHELQHKVQMSKYFFNHPYLLLHISGLCSITVLVEALSGIGISKKLNYLNFIGLGFLVLKSGQTEIFNNRRLMEIDADLYASKDSNILRSLATQCKEDYKKYLYRGFVWDHEIKNDPHLPYLQRYKYLMIQAKRIQQNKPLLTAQEVFTQWKITKNVV